MIAVESISKPHENRIFEKRPCGHWWVWRWPKAGPPRDPPFPWEHPYCHDCGRKEPGIPGETVYEAVAQ